MLSDSSSAANTVPLTFKLRLPSSTAFLIALPMLLAMLTPISPALTLSSFVSSVLLPSSSTATLNEHCHGDFDVFWSKLCKE